MNRKMLVGIIIAGILLAGGCSGSGSVQSGEAVLEDLNAFGKTPDFLTFETVDIEQRQEDKENRTETVICRLTGDTQFSVQTYDAQLLYQYSQTDGWRLESADMELKEVQIKEEPKERFNPQEAFIGVPYDSFEAVWLEGGMGSAEGLRAVYEETYDFELKKELAVIPYTVSGKLIQTCEYIPSGDRWDVSFRTEDIIQEMDLSIYRWEEEKGYYTETFVKTGPNTFASGEPGFTSGPYFTVDILGGGFGLKDDEGRASLPGGAWTARMYVEFRSFPAFTAKASIDLVSGIYGYNESRFMVPMDEILRVETERSKTDEDRAREETEIYRQTFPQAASFENMDPSLAAECSRMLESCEFGDVKIEKAAAAKDSSGATVGWVVQARSEDSYVEHVTVSAGIKNDGSIVGLEVLELEDTVGLGMNAKDEAFRNQFIGKHGKMLTVTQSEHAGDDEIDAISGATITSAAVTNAVNAALYYVLHFT